MLPNLRSDVDELVFRYCLNDESLFDLVSVMKRYVMTVSVCLSIAYVDYRIETRVRYTDVSRLI